MKPLNFALIGAGRFGKHYIRLLKTNKKARLAAVCTKTNESLREISNTLPKNTIKTNDVDFVLKNQKIDCAIIATPLSTHYELALKTIKEGKHVLLEKPMVQTLPQAKKLSTAIKKSGVTFMVGHQYVYNDYINYIKAANEKNFFGQPKFFIAEHLYFGKTRNGVSCFWDAGTHQLSVLLYLFNPGKITSVSGQSIDISGLGFDNFTAATITFENNLAASLLVSSLSPHKTRKFAIIGDSGSAFFDDCAQKQKLELFKNAFPKTIKQFGKKIFAAKKIQSIKQKINENEPLKNQLEHFIYCVKNKKMPKTGIDESIVVTKWLQEISRKIKLPAKKVF